jgi:hypothetical protein
MISSERGRTGLEQEADSIERVLAALSLPVRVRGGMIREGHVRFQLSEQAGGFRRQLEGALAAVAAALGAQVGLAEQGGGLALEVRPPDPDGLRLLPLLDVLGELPPFHLALGMGLDGRPLVVDLASPSTWHVLAIGEPGSGKSELLRSALVALALGTAPLEVRVLGIDLSGRQLSPLEAIPHSVTELASEPRFAGELLEWSVSQLRERRGRGGPAREAPLQEPHLVLWVDDLGALLSAGLPRAAGQLRLLLEHGPVAQLHVMIAGSPGPMRPLLDLTRDGALHAYADPRKSGQPGEFVFSSLRGRREARLAWLPAPDLNSAVRLIEAQWLGSAKEGR